MKPRAFRSRLLVGVSALSALVVVACEKDSPTAAASAVASAPATSATAATLEPCRLLTTGEASTFLEGSAIATPSEGVSYASACIWEARDPLRGLQVMTSSPSQLRAEEELRKIGSDTIEKRFTLLFKAKTLEGTGTPVPDLGDAALWVAASKQLWIMKKERALITVSFHGEGANPDALDRARAVARKVLERL